MSRLTFLSLLNSRAAWHQSKISRIFFVSQSTYHLVSEWNFTYSFGFWIKRHVPIWFRSETLRTRLISKWNVTYRLVSEWNVSYRVISEWNVTYYLVSEWSVTYHVVSEWNVTYPFSFGVKHHVPIWFRSETSHAIWFWNETSRAVWFRSETSRTIFNGDSIILWKYVLICPAKRNLTFPFQTKGIYSRT